MEKDKITKTVNRFKTKYKEGFIYSEIKLLLKQFTKVSYKKFNKALGAITCIYLHQEVVIYKHDVTKAIDLCMKKRTIKLEEWD